MKTHPQKITIIYSDLNGLPIAALEYLLLHLNTLQDDIEYQFLPINSGDALFTLLNSKEIVPIKKFYSTVDKFNDQFSSTIKKTAIEYNEIDGTIGRIVIISLATLQEHWYEVYEKKYSAIFLGDWEKTMAPPSLLEFILSMVIMEGLYYLMGSEAVDISHLGTRGCIGDFNPTLKDVRYKTLQGFICSDCMKVLEKAIGIEKTEVWLKLLKKDWLGSLSDTNSPASIVNKLGYNLFITKGLTPSFWEKTKQTLTEDGVKEILKLIGGILLAAILVWLGLKK